MHNYDVVTLLGAGFSSHTVPLAGVDLHYVRGGRGPALVLLHGFPQDWSEWRHIMPVLAKRFTVVAVDLRGIGRSTLHSPVSGLGQAFDADTLAEDIRGLVDWLGFSSVHVAGHDVGAWVAYSLARRHPDRVRTATVIEAPIPGIEPWVDLPARVPMWHPEFHLVPQLPEALVDGRQGVYFQWFFDTFTAVRGAVRDADVQRYAGAYRDRSALGSAFGMYRAIPVTAAANAAAMGSVAVPLLLVGSERLFAPILPELAQNLRNAHGWAEVQVRTVADGGHYLPEERPKETAVLIGRHATRHQPPPQPMARPAAGSPRG